MATNLDVMAGITVTSVELNPSKDSVPVRVKDSVSIISVAVQIARGSTRTDPMLPGRDNLRVRNHCALTLLVMNHSGLTRPSGWILREMNRYELIPRFG